MATIPYYPIAEAKRKFEHDKLWRCESYITNMVTYVIQIGNTDDKLTQVEWHNYTKTVQTAVEDIATHIHFWGAPANFEPWQNLCCICEVPKENEEHLSTVLTGIRTQFRQDSIAITTGETKFI